MHTCIQTNTNILALISALEGVPLLSVGLSKEDNPSLVPVSETLNTTAEISFSCAAMWGVQKGDCYLLQLVIPPQKKGRKVMFFFSVGDTVIQFTADSLLQDVRPHCSQSSLLLNRGRHSMTGLH